MDAYILPQEITINRDINNNFIQFNGISCDKIVTDTGLYNLVPNNGNTKIQERSEVDLHQTTIHVKLYFDDKGEDKPYISMDIVRPLNRTDYLLGDEIMNGRSKKLASQYRKRTFDESGVHYSNIIENSTNYSTERIQPYCGSYLIGGNCGEIDKMKFVFLQTNNHTIKETKLQIDEQHHYLNGVPKNTNGVIVQSLKNRKPRITYIEPYWVGQQYDFAQSCSAIERLKKCIEHDLYYDVLMRKDDITSELFFKYCKECDDNNQGINYKLLWEVSQSVGGNWFLISRPDWKKIIVGDKAKRECVNNLLHSCPNEDSDQLNTFVDGFWDMKWTARNRPQGRASDAKRYIYYIITGENEFRPVSMPAMSDINSEIERIINKKQ